MDLKKLKETPRAKWFHIETRAGEFDALIAPFANRQWQLLYDRLTAKHRRQMRENGGELPIAISDPILQRCAAETILLDWRGVSNGNGDIPFSVQAAADLLDDEEVRAAVSKASLDLANTRAHEIEDDAGN